jgi:hypothetical protein
LPSLGIALSAVDIAIVLTLALLTRVGSGLRLLLHLDEVRLDSTYFAATDLVCEVVQGQSELVLSLLGIGVRL